MARPEVEKKRSIHEVCEHFFPPINAAIGQEMMVLKPVLEPALDDDFGIGKKFKNLLAMSLDVTKHGVAGTTKREKTHGRGNADVYTEHTGFCTVFELTRGGTAVGINTGCITKATRID
jgi:hypothetical protein